MTPPPALAPPALHFLVLDFTITCGSMEFTFVCTTDTAVRLTLHLTTEKPIIRRIPYVKRGADFTMSSVTCFVETVTIDQDEAGDTFAHTFTVPIAGYGIPYYWYLTGTHSGQPSNSISQIFQVQCAAPITPPVTVKLYSSHQGGPNGTDCQPQRIGTRISWANVHDGIQTHCYNYFTQLHPGWTQGGQLYTWSNLRRIKVTHNLASIPSGSVILSVTYHGLIHARSTYAGNAPAWALYQITTLSYTNCHAIDYQNMATIPISNIIPYADATPGTWAQWQILPAYLHLFQPTQYSAFALREHNYDALNIQPTSALYSSLELTLYAVDDLTLSKRPYLEITYDPP